MWSFSELQSIELKSDCLAQYFAGKGVSAHPDELKYRVRFDRGIPHDAIMWCVDNCQNKWGWLFVNLEPHKTIPHCDEAYLLFEDESDATYFKLQYRF